LRDEIKALRTVRANQQVGADNPVHVPVEDDEDLSAPLMFASIHIMSPKIFDYIPRGVFSDSVKDTYPAAMADGQRVTSYIGRGYWYEFSTLRRYLDISLEFLRREGQNNSLGAGTAIEPGALVADCVLWNRVKIERDATLRRCIIGDDVVIPADTHMEDLVVVRADRVPNIERGTVFGDNIVVPIG
jgi:NDP-sugar pyrophosphorylase family protein